MVNGNFQMPTNNLIMTGPQSLQIEFDFRRAVHRREQLTDIQGNYTSKAAIAQCRLERGRISLRMGRNVPPDSTEHFKRRPHAKMSSSFANLARQQVLSGETSISQRTPKTNLVPYKQILPRYVLL
jgi:hypothetical protein